MKSLFLFALGVVAGAFGWRWVEQWRSGTPADVSVARDAAAPLDHAREAGDRLAARLREWRLDHADIQRELAETGRVLRHQARAAGARMDDARIIAVIKAKYVLDDGLAAAAVNVGCRDGRVRLTGEVASPDAIGRAVALALETHGVVEVDAELRTPR